MAQLIVRQLDESVVQNLKERAARNGHSTEEEHRQILCQALDSRISVERRGMGLKEVLASAPEGFSDLDFGERNRSDERPDPFAP